MEIGLNAAIVSVQNDEPVVLVVRDETEPHAAGDSLPYGPFAPLEHRTLEIGLRSWVRAQTGLDFGYVEQLYTFGDRGRHAQADDQQPHVVSIGYLALTHFDDAEDQTRGTWRSWYHYFPWEDWRKGRPAVLDEEIVPRLRTWAASPQLRPSSERPLRREDRLRMCFGIDGGTWDEEKVLDRYELLYEAGLAEEARRDRPETAGAAQHFAGLGGSMVYDHRRILATAISRLRAKIKYRPVVFELMPPEFTLFELQKTVEAILGPHLHKQNFRRLVESAGLVEPTGDMKTRTGGRPAKLFRFRREVLLERPAPGVRVKPGRA
ncbi:MAG: NAD regulator [Hyphomicrobiaceae bacterium]